jgi:hypothetical protein
LAKGGDTYGANLKSHVNFSASKWSSVAVVAVSVDHIVSGWSQCGDGSDDVNDNWACSGRARKCRDVQITKVDWKSNGGVSAYWKRIVKDIYTIPSNCGGARSTEHGNVHVTSKLDQIIALDGHSRIKSDLTVVGWSCGHGTVFPRGLLRRSDSNGSKGGERLHHFGCVCGRERGREEVLELEVTVKGEKFAL